MYNDQKGSRTKSESQLRGAHLQLASRKGETHWNDSGNPGHKIRANTKISVTGHKKSEVISSLFHTLALSHPSSLMVLAWKLSSLRHLHLVRESKLPALGFYILKASPIRKEKIEEIRDRGCSLNDPPQITCTVLDQRSWQGHRVLCLALHGLVALTQQHTWLSISSRTTRLKIGRGSPKDNAWRVF